MATVLFCEDGIANHTTLNISHNYNIYILRYLGINNDQGSEVEDEDDFEIYSMVDEEEIKEEYKGIEEEDGLYF